MAPHPSLPGTALGHGEPLNRKAPRRFPSCNRRSETMKTIALGLAATLAFAVSTARADENLKQDIAQDKADLAKDKSDLAKDRADVKKDRADVAKDRADLKKDATDARPDPQELRKAHRAPKADQQEVA